MFLPVFRAGKQAEAGRKLASAAGWRPALALNEWVRRGELQRLPECWPGTCVDWNRLQPARGGGGMCRLRASSVFTLASCLSRFFSEIEHMLCSSLCMSDFVFSASTSESL